jgi:hypothetical protein
VLYAAEWWRREYSGGAWRWPQILESITKGPCNFDVYERTDAVERGLRVWRHQPSLYGKKYFGAIVAQGGLPLQMIAQGDGAVTKLLVRGMRQAQLLGWDEERLGQYFKAHELDLVQHLREAEIFRLLASVVWIVLELRTEWRLAGSSNPLEILDSAQPKWRDRFPIAADDRSAESLLTGLVKEAARVIKVVNSYPASISRTLTRCLDSQEFDLVMSIQLASNITLEALSAAMGVSSKLIPQSFTLELEGRSRTKLGTGRQLLGGEESTVILGGKLHRLTNDDAQSEVLMVLRGLGSDLHVPVAIPGGDGLEDSQPWIFANKDSELALLAVGSCNLPDEIYFVAVPEAFSVEPCEDSHANLVGSISGLSQCRKVFEIEGNVIVSDSCERYEVRTSQSQDESAQLVWKGSRLTYRTTPYPIYQGVPNLYRLDAEGLLHPVSSRDIEWVDPKIGGDIVADHGLHHGLIDAWVKNNGIRQRRFRMALIPSDAKIRFTSGATEIGGDIEFQGWGLNEINTSQDLQVSSEISAGSAKLTVESTPHPPATFLAAMTWPNTDQLLRIELPFPSTGGRFSTRSGEILANKTTIPLRKLEEIRLQVYDQNPDTPKRYTLSIELQGSSYQPIIVPIPLKSDGFGGIRLFEIESNLDALLCQSDSLDAKLTLNLCVGYTSIRQLNLTRYDAPLERESDYFSLSSESLEFISLDARFGMKLRAVPLLEVQGKDIALDQMFSEGAPTGRWNAGQLAHQHAHWLLYPAEDSILQIRPTVFATTSSYAFSVLTGNRCDLSIAMSATTQNDRDRRIRSVVVDMSNNLEHESWEIVEHHHKILSHLPLATLDYWRAFGASHEASIAVVLKLSSNIPALMQRMSHELGVIWEMTPNKVLSAALKSLSVSLSKQLDLEIGSEMHKDIVSDLFRKLGFGSNSIATQIDLVLFQGGFGKGNHFKNISEAYKKPRLAILQNLWVGADSMLQRILLRAHSEDRDWPQFELTEALLKVMTENCDQYTKQYLLEFLGDLIWFPATGQCQKDKKTDVVNAPFLAALLVKLTGSSEWLFQKGRMAQLREIRAFDPDWFESSIQAGGILAALESAHVVQKPKSQRIPSLQTI